MTTTINETQSKKATACLSKKRFEIFSKDVKEYLGEEDKANQIMELLKNALNFDPEISRYTPEIGQKDMQRRRERAEKQNISLYKLNKVDEYRKRKKLEKQQ